MVITQLDSSTYCQFSFNVATKKVGENKLFYIKLLIENMGVQPLALVVLLSFFPSKLMVSFYFLVEIKNQNQIAAKKFPPSLFTWVYKTRKYYLSNHKIYFHLKKLEYRDCKIIFIAFTILKGSKKHGFSIHRRFSLLPIQYTF